MWPSFYDRYAPLKHSLWSQRLFVASLFILATCSASSFFFFAQRELFGRRAGWRSARYLPFLMAIGVGISLNNSKAVFEAIWGAIKRKPSEFVRTPKYGVTGQEKKSWQPSQVWTFKRLALPLVEIAFGVYMFVCLVVSVIWWFGIGSTPFLALFAGGYLYVGFSSLYTLWRMTRQADEETLAVADPVEQLSA